MNKVYKVKVRRYNDEEWEEWTGNFSESNGYNIENIEEFIKHNFSKDHFDVYMFGLFIRQDIKINNLYVFDFVKEINIIRDNRNIDLS